MKANLSLPSFAPGILGAFFLSLASGSCRDKAQSSDWQGQKTAAAPAPEAPAKAPETAPAKPAAAPAEEASSEEDSGDGATTARPTSDTMDGTRFVTYNVENWLTMDRTEKGVHEQGKPKPEKERAAMVSMIMAAKPDVLGVCELGSDADVVDIQKRLADAGHPMPYHIFVGGVDPTRHLGLISRFEIGQPVAHENLTYTSHGKSYGMQRGILDATIQTPSGPMRFLGVHLKSKRPVPGDDEEDMRLNEAHLLRREIDAILDKDPKANLVVYGDMNDTYNSDPIKVVQGTPKTPKALSVTGLKDSRGEYWTEQWKYQDVYSRIDYVMLSSSLKSSLVWNECRVMDEPMWEKGSDHRPLLVVFKKKG